MGKNTLHLPSKVTAIRNITFVKYEFANLVEKKKRGIQKGEENIENILKMPLFISYQPTKSRIHKKAESIIEKKRIKEREN